VVLPTRWPLRWNRRGLEGEMRRDAMEMKVEDEVKRHEDASSRCTGAVAWSKLGDSEAAAHAYLTPPGGRG